MFNFQGGYGRPFTNYHSFQSYEEFTVALQFEGVKTTFNNNKDFHIVKIDKPLEKPGIGKYYVGLQGEGE